MTAHALVCVQAIVRSASGPAGSGANTFGPVPGSPGGHLEIVETLPEPPAGELYRRPASTPVPRASSASPTPDRPPTMHMHVAGIPVYTGRDQGFATGPVQRWEFGRSRASAPQNSSWGRWDVLDKIRAGYSPLLTLARTVRRRVPTISELHARPCSVPGCLELLPGAAEFPLRPTPPGCRRVPACPPELRSKTLISPPSTLRIRRDVRLE